MLDFFLTNGLSVEERSQVEKMLSAPVFFKKGELIYDEENYKRAIGVVKSGSLTVKTNQGENVIIRNLKTRETFGVSAVFGEESSFVSKIYAEKDSEIFFLSEETLRQIFAKFPIAVENYIRLLSKKIRFLNSKIALLSVKSAEQRVYEFLCSNCDEKGIALFQNMKNVSERLGIGRSSLYRCLDELTKQNLIIKNGKEFKVIDYEKIF